MTWSPFSFCFRNLGFQVIERLITELRSDLDSFSVRNEIWKFVFLPIPSHSVTFFPYQTLHSAIGKLFSRKSDILTLKLKNNHQEAILKRSLLLINQNDSIRKTNWQIWSTMLVVKEVQFQVIFMLILRSYFLFTGAERRLVNAVKSSNSKNKCTKGWHKGNNVLKRSCIGFDAVYLP